MTALWMHVWVWGMAGLGLSMFMADDLEPLGRALLCLEWGLAGFGASALLHAVDAALGRRWPGFRRQLVGRFVLLVALGTPLFFVGLVVLIRAWPVEPTPPLRTAQALLETMVLMAMNLAAWALGHLLLEQQVLRERAQRIAVEAESQSVQMSLALLRQQLHPHFLFNAINTISSVVDEEPRRAQALLVDLSSLLHGALTPPPGELVTLADELRLLRPYLALEQARWERGLRVTMAVDPDAETARLPWMALQTLVENAIKHARRTADGVRHVRIQAWRRGGELRLDVTNGGTLGSSRRPGAGVGLSNLRARLRELFGAEARLQLEEVRGEVRARLTIPVRPVDYPPRTVAHASHRAFRSLSPTCSLSPNSR
ncbi:MAG: histidine kinase [Myxococcota bacterium]